MEASRRRFREETAWEKETKGLLVFLSGHALCLIIAPCPGCLLKIPFAVFLVRVSAQRARPRRESEVAATGGWGAGGYVGVCDR